ncbi:MAG: hypothetical protein J0H40_17275 [Rhizobiales bacterium]|nr:hypothetical protein [Hyphomicrobiales bacterium]
MRAFTLLEGETSARMIRVRGNGTIIVHEGGRRRLHARVTDLDRNASTWALLARVVPAIAHAESVRSKIDRLVERAMTGWTPASDEIDADIPQRTLKEAVFATDLLAFPDDPDLMHYSRAYRLLGRDESGFGASVGEILWIAANREWAICDDGFWWLP